MRLKFVARQITCWKAWRLERVTARHIFPLPSMQPSAASPDTLRIFVALFPFISSCFLATLYQQPGRLAVRGILMPAMMRGPPVATPSRRPQLQPSQTTPASLRSQQRPWRPRFCSRFCRLPSWGL